MKTNTFIKRTLTVLILLPLVIWLILGTSIFTFEVVSAIFCLGAAWEWAALIGVKTKFNRFVYTILMLAALSIVQFIPFIYVLWIGLIWWVLAIFILWHYIKTQTKRQMRFVSAIMGFFAIVPCWVGLNSLRSGPHGAEFLLFFFFLLWAVDTGAYLFGMKFGKRKLAPHLSPGKTIEGVMGGFLFMCVFLILGIWLLHVPSVHWLPLFIIVLLMAVFSIIGDLFESMLKRKCNVKDSGSILPGHGGFLDRMDSALAAAPIFSLAILLTGFGH